MAQHSRALRLRRTAAAAAVRRLQDSEELFRLAFETAPAGMAVVSLTAGSRGRLLLVNDAFCAFTGRDRGQLLGTRMAHVLHPDDVLRHEAHLLRAVLHAEIEPSGVERRFVTPDGVVRWGRGATSLLRPRGGREARLLVVVEDVTEERAAQAALTHAAHHDPLTGLANRTLLSRRLDLAAAPGERGEDRVTLLFVDLDDFKAVNDTHGHAVGDALLREVAQLLRGAVRERDSVARLGGDEFAVLCPGLDGAAAEALAARVEAALSTVVVLPGGVLVEVAASVGLATSADGEELLHLLDRADRSMYSMKALRRSGHPGWGGSAAVPEVRAPDGGAGEAALEGQSAEALRSLQALQSALEARVVVEQASGYLAASLRLSVAQARALLLDGASVRGTAVRALAQELVEGRTVAAELAR